MQTHLQQILPQPRVFHYSLDWRFLLPIADTGEIRVVVEEDAEFSQTLEQVGISASDQFSFSDIARIEGDSIRSLVFPFGLPVGWVSAQQADQIEFYRSIRHLIYADGYFMIGFENSWDFWSKSQSKYYPSTPRRIARQLTLAGYKSIKIFGAMPNLRIPEYIFDLQAPAIHFALQQRFRRKPIMRSALKILSRIAGLAHISNYLPCYFAVARV